MSYLADKSGDDGRGIFPSKKTIALECELSKNTVIKILREFVEEGLLEEVGIHTQWRTTIYNISLSNLVRLPDLAKGGSKLHPRAEAIVEGVQNDTLGVQSVNPIGSATEPKQPDKNLNYARARERLKRALAPHCAGNERDERLMHTYLQFVQGFDGQLYWRAILCTQIVFFVTFARNPTPGTAVAAKRLNFSVISSRKVLEKRNPRAPKRTKLVNILDWIL